MALTLYEKDWDKLKEEMPLRELIPKPLQGQRPLTQYLLWPQFLPFLLMLVVIGAVVWGIDVSARQSKELMQAQQRLTIIDQIARNVLDSETGLRGYLLMDDESFLVPYRSGQQALSHNLNLLERQPATLLQYQNIQQVRYLMDSWRQQVAEPLLESVKSKEFNQDKLRLMSVDKGKSLIDQTRIVIATLEKNEMTRRATAMKASSRALGLTRLLTISGLLLAALLIWLSAMRSARTLSKVLGELNRDVAHIAEGHYDFQLPRLPIVEVQSLGDQFGQMARAVREREQRLQRSNTDLERSNRELEQFAYIASHDLQEPLRTIGSYTELLAKRYGGQLDARADKYIGFTLSATHRLKRLIQDLLAFSRVRQPGREMTLVNIQDLVQTVLHDLSVAIEAQQAQIEVGQLPTLRGNPELLRHIFQNLISNAIKFRKPDSPAVVRIYAVHLPDAWQFSVSDNGIGIESEYFERIFGVFQHLGNKTVEGSGIGLAVVRTAVERHGGEVTVQSVLGEGSTFSFTVPHTLPDESEPLYTLALNTEVAATDVPATRLPGS